MVKRQGKTIAQVAMEQVGFRRGYVVSLYIACWWICERALGRPPETVDEYASWWEQKREKAFRDQRTFRQAFPGYATPSELAVACGVVVADQSERERDRLAVDVAGLVVA